MRIILPTEVFPPDGKGGAAWSSHALACALLARGHSVAAVVPVRGARGTTRYDALGVPAVRVGYYAPRLPIVQNYFRHERLWHPLAKAIVAEARRGPQPDVIHAQHVQAAPAAVLAGRELDVPVVVTVRDHWPWDYFATGLHGDQVPYARPGWPGLATNLMARLGPLRGAVALPALPYMLAHLRRRAAFLAQADAVIAVSSYIARRLASIVSPRCLHVLPNMVDITAATDVAAAPPELRDVSSQLNRLPGARGARREAQGAAGHVAREEDCQATAPTEPWEGALLLFAGKLEPNKGAGLLPAIFRELRGLGRSLPPFTLVVAGDGVLRQTLARELHALEVPTLFLAWAGHDEVLRLMARCDLLLFPSAWGDPLSRVLLEGASLGAPILAMPTGGTPDVVADGTTGALAPTPRTFAARLASLLDDPAERRRLGEGARTVARAHFDISVVAPHYEALYRSLLDRGQGRAQPH